ncbi:MAG: hypothetical protein U9P80_04565, partial [Thermodesulfobacteriota bacterium]|nr:hypothetical protein [Thermodesulfobacteriota bacterium]
MGGAPSFSEKLQRFDLNAWFRVSAAGLVYCIILYTFFGFVFVHRHAGMISMEMEAYISHGMSPLIAPGDPAITDMGCLLGSSVFFGLTLGVMNAVLAMAFSIVPWSRGRFSRHDIMPAVSLAALSIYLCFSTELPIVSIGAGLITLPVFFLSWIYPAKKVPRTKTPFIQWVVFVLLLLTPLLVLHNTTFWQIRDAMLVCPLSSSLSDFYYKHTLLAADVIKPAQFRTQNLVA